jgi:hypothetical protein
MRVVIMRAAGPVILALCGLLVLSSCGASGGGTPASGASTSGPSATSSARGSNGATATSGTVSGSTSTATLRCTISEEPLTADTLAATLSCTVVGAASDQTSFAVSHSASGLKGQTHVVDATCGGPLHDGTGMCTKTFILSPHTSGFGSVTGQLLPSHQSLGPVTPTSAA